MAPPSATTDNGTLSGGTKQDDKAIPYQGPQPYGMPDDLVIPNIMDIDGADERLWVSSNTYQKLANPLLMSR